MLETRRSLSLQLSISASSIPCVSGYTKNAVVHSLFDWDSSDFQTTETRQKGGEQRMTHSSLWQNKPRQTEGVESNRPTAVLRDKLPRERATKRPQNYNFDGTCHVLPGAENFQRVKGFNCWSLWCSPCTWPLTAKAREGPKCSGMPRRADVNACARGRFVGSAASSELHLRRSTLEACPDNKITNSNSA